MNGTWLAGFKSTVTTLQQAIQAHKTTIGFLRVDIQNSAGFPYIYPTKAVPGHAFYTQQEPLLLLAGANDQYPSDPGQKLNVRTDGQEVLNIAPPFPPIQGLDATASSGGLPYPLWTVAPNNEKFASFCNDSQLASKLDEKIMPVATRLLIEGELIADYKYPKPGYGVFGEYALDRFPGANGWFPLFVEYEVEYYNIPSKYWKFQPCAPESRISYCVLDGFNVDNNMI